MKKKPFKSLHSLRRAVDALEFGGVEGLNSLVVPPEGEAAGQVGVAVEVGRHQRYEVPGGCYWGYGWCYGVL